MLDLGEGLWKGIKNKAASGGRSQHLAPVRALLLAAWEMYWQQAFPCTESICSSLFTALHTGAQFHLPSQQTQNKLDCIWWNLLSKYNYKMNILWSSKLEI